MDPHLLTSELKAEARRLGFDQAGVCPAVTPAGIERFQQWLEAGYAGEMTYLADRRTAYADPAAVLSGVRSIVMLAMNYRTAEPQAAQHGQGRISRYAWGRDYHDLIRKRLDGLADFLRGRVPAPPSAAWSTPLRCWSESSPRWPGWAGSARTRSS